MNIKFQMIELDENVNFFVFDSLKNGNSISKKIIKLLNSNTFKIWALLPKDIRISEIYKFKSGGICNVKDSEKLLEENIRYFINKSYCNCCIIEESLTRIGDPILKNTNKKYFNYSNEIYYYILKKVNYENTILNIIKTANRYPFICYFSQINQELKEKLNNNNILNNDLLKITSNIKEIFIGAYDEESYLKIGINI